MPDNNHLCIERLYKKDAKEQRESMSNRKKRKRD